MHNYDEVAAELRERSHAAAAEGLDSFTAYQEERRQRWEQARQGGDYHFAATVAEKDLPVATDLARQLSDGIKESAAEHVSMQQTWSESGFTIAKLAHAIRYASERRRLVAFDRHLEAPAIALCNLVQMELVGNIDLAEIEMESGLLEPYDPIRDISMLAPKIARQILEGKVIIRPDDGR